MSRSLEGHWPPVGGLWSGVVLEWVSEGQGRKAWGGFVVLDQTSPTCLCIRTKSVSRHLSLLGREKYSGVDPLVGHGSLGTLGMGQIATCQNGKQQWELHGGWSATKNSCLRRGFLLSKMRASVLFWQLIDLGQEEIKETKLLCACLCKIDGGFLAHWQFDAAKDLV